MKIDRVAIITLYGNFNYGNKLQNYAVEQLFISYGIEPVTINYTKSNKIEKAKKIFRIITNYRFSKNKDIWITQAKKENFLKKFSDKYLHVKKQTVLKRLNTQYDYFCVGSDQVWNPVWFDDRTKHLMLLDFVDKTKKMTISVSFGIEVMQNEWREFFKERLSEFEKISVREESAEKIVKELCDVEVDTYIDPTLMLDSKKWMEIAEKPMEFSEEYIRNSIVLYFLGSLDCSDMEKIRDVARKYDLHIIALDKRSIQENFIPSLEEWLYCIGNAKLVVTDSFHGSAFSFLFDRNLIVCERKDEYNKMFYRLENFIGKFKLEDRFVENCQSEKVFKHDYSVGYRILQYEREKMKKYIESVV